MVATLTDGTGENSQTSIYDCEPVYEEVEGWKEDISGIREYGDLPASARDYIEFVEKLVGVPITTISVGPARSATIVK